MKLETTEPRVNELRTVTDRELTTTAGGVAPTYGPNGEIRTCTDPPFPKPGFPRPLAPIGNGPFIPML